MESESWQCPFCSKHATIREGDVTESQEYLRSDVSDKTAYLFYRAVKCPNANCEQVSLYVEYRTVSNGYISSARARNATPVKQWQLLPESEAKPQPDCIPEAIREDYYEAFLIKSKSPKASATLSRRCLQAMIRDFWKIKDKKNLAQEIEAIKEKIDPNIWGAIDAVRKIGNIGAHMEQDVNLILDIEPQEAGALIGLLEMLFEDWYVADQKRKENVQNIIDMAQQKEAQKKQPSADPAPPENEPE